MVDDPSLFGFVIHRDVVKLYTGGRHVVALAIAGQKFAAGGSQDVSGILCAAGMQPDDGIKVDFDLRRDHGAERALCGCDDLDVGGASDLCDTLQKGQNVLFIDGHQVRQLIDHHIHTGPGIFFGSGALHFAVAHFDDLQSHRERRKGIRDIIRIFDGMRQFPVGRQFYALQVNEDELIGVRGLQKGCVQNPVNNYRLPGPSRAGYEDVRLLQHIRIEGVIVCCGRDICFCHRFLHYLQKVDFLPVHLSMSRKET